MRKSPLFVYVSLTLFLFLASSTVAQAQARAPRANTGFLAALTSLFLDSCSAANNGTQAVTADGSVAVVRITNYSFTGNTGQAFATANSGKSTSFGSNFQDGNGGASTPTPPTVPPQ